jgi:signal peptidase I
MHDPDHSLPRSESDGGSEGMGAAGGEASSEAGAPPATHMRRVTAASRQATSFAQSVWEWAKSIGFAFFLFLVIRTFLIQAFKIPTGSMEDTLLIGDFLLVNKAVYGAQIPGTHYRLPAFEAVGRQDVIVFEYPDPNDEYSTKPDYVKRVVGLPGDTVQMVEKRVYVNGRSLNEPYAHYLPIDPDDHYEPQFEWQRRYLAPGYDPVAYRPTKDNWGPLVVPPGKYMVLGDNRDNSADSRYWGFVDTGLIKGKPLIVYFSKKSDELIPEFHDIRYQRIGNVIK